MFIGHYAAGFGAKAAQPRVSLGTLFLAAQFSDLLWPVLLLFGLETVEIVPGITTVTPFDFVHYPISHSLLAVIGWSLLLGGVYWWVRRSTRGAVVVGLVGMSHWVLDLIVHRPDLPLYPGESPLLGLGLWNSVVGTVLVEGLLFVFGAALYLRMTAARNRVGSYALWVLIGFLLVVYAGNLLGPPPPNTSAIVWAGLLQWGVVAWAYWIDWNRSGVGKA